MVNKNRLSFSIMFLIISSVFIFPMQIGSIYAADSDNKRYNVQEQAQVGAVCGGNAINNVRNSLVMSVVTLCLPGILEKVNEWKDMRCRKVVCKYDAVINNIDPSHCEAEYAFNQCKLIVGEVFALPPMAILEYFRSVIANIIANPVGLLYSGVVLSARATVSGACAADATGGNGMICNFAWGSATGLTAARIFLWTNDAIALFQTTKDLIDNGFDQFAPRQNYCDQMEDIKKEMEEILGILDAEEAQYGGSQE